MAEKIRTWAVLAVAAIAAVISYQHICHLAITHGQGPLASALLALCVDGAVLVATVSMLSAAGLWLWWARGLLLLSVGATLAANVAYGIPYGPAGAVISGWPAVAFFGCAELAIGMARHATPDARPEKKVAPAKPEQMPAAMPALHAVPDASPDEAARQAWLASGRTLSPRKLAEAHGRSRMYWAPRIERWEAMA